MRTNSLVEFNKYNRKAIMKMAWSYAKSLFNGDLSKGLKAAWRSAKLLMAEVTNIQSWTPNPYTKMSDLYTTTNMRNGYATR